MNSSLLNYIKGNQHIEMQIVDAVYKVQMLPQLACNTLFPGSESELFYQQMTCKLKVPDGAVLMHRNCTSLGAVDKVAQLSETIHQQV